MPAPTLVVGAPCWIDLYSSDTDKASAFYAELFGWKAEPAQEEEETPAGNGDSDWGYTPMSQWGLDDSD